MKVAELRALLDRQRATDAVVVAGHGRLLFVTHGGSESGAPVCVLYVEEPHDPEVAAAEPPAAPAPTGATS
jgi:hypothetical protein